MALRPDIDMETYNNVQVAKGVLHHVKQLSMNPATAPKPMTTVETKLIESSLGHNYTQFTKQGLFFLDYLESTISGAAFNATLAQHLLPELHPRQTRYEGMMWFICDVIEIYRSSSDLAIDGVLKSLCNKDKAFQDTPAACNDPQLKLLVFRK